MPKLPPKHNPFPRSPDAERQRKAAVDRARAKSPVRAWYRDRRWHKRRAQQLKAAPRCSCGAPATHADHDPPHKGDEWLFFNGPLKSRCGRCHNALTARYDGGFGNPVRPRPPGAAAHVRATSRDGGGDRGEGG